MNRALLIGTPPPCDLGCTYVTEGDHDGVVIGSLTLSQLLCFRETAVLDALSQGKPVVLFTPGLPTAGSNRALAASLAGAQRQLKSWGVVFTDGARKHLITAQEAKQLRNRGLRPAAGAVLTPLAREILEGMQ